MKKTITLLYVLAMLCLNVNAQNTFALKLNAAALGYYPISAGSGVGIGFETNTGEKSTLGVNATFGKVQDFVALRYSISPEFRYYFKTAFEGFYVAGNFSYDQFKPINDLKNNFGSYLFGIGASVGTNVILKDNIIFGINLGAQATGPSRSTESVKSKLIANIELGYRF